jgi:hypothetical protein
MNRRLRTLAVVASVAVTVSGVSGTQAFASGGSGGGGGGGSTTTATTGCGGLTALVQASTTGWAVAGSSSKACDPAPVSISFVDATPTDGCSLFIGTYTNSMYFKYGNRPPSRYASEIYQGGSCAGTSHAITATMFDRTTNAVIATATTTWTAP